MKPVMQTKFKDNGNCFPAALASILEIPLEEVPEPQHDNPRWLGPYRRWLNKRFGLSLEWFEAADRRKPFGYSIASLETGEEYGHAVVFFNGKPVHDPKTKSLAWAKKAKVRQWYVFTINNPAKVIHK